MSQYWEASSNEESSTQDKAPALENTPSVVWMPMLVPYWQVSQAYAQSGSHAWRYPQPLYSLHHDATENVQPGDMTLDHMRQSYYWGYPQPYAGPFYGVEDGNRDAADSKPASVAGKTSENDDQQALPESSDSCQAAGESDTHSDASTDVGDDDEVGDLIEDCEEDVGLNPSEDSLVTRCQEEAPKRGFAGYSLFPKVSRRQRVDQLNRIIDEFCELEFDAVDASSQGGLVLRMLTILKSLRESASFYDEQGRMEEKRTSLLGLSIEDEKKICSVISQAQDACEGRLFRDAFDALKRVAPVLHRETAQPQKMSVEEVEAMKQRRLEKRMRQRQERRVQRAADKTNRIAQQRRGSNAGGTSCSSSSAWQPACDNAPHARMPAKSKGSSRRQ